MGIRSKAEDELAGLDMPEMGAPAYWDDGEPLKGGVFPIPAPAFGGASGD